MRAENRMHPPCKLFSLVALRRDADLPPLVRRDLDVIAADAVAHFFVAVEPDDLTPRDEAHTHRVNDGEPLLAEMRVVARLRACEVAVHFFSQPLRLARTLEKSEKKL